MILVIEERKKLLVQSLKNLDFDKYINILSEILPTKIYRYFDHSNKKIELLNSIF